MPDTSQRAVGDTKVRLDFDVIKQRCDQLGATTDAERAELAGISLRTYQRLRDGTKEPLISTAVRIGARLDLPIDDLVPAVRA